MLREQLILKRPDTQRIGCLTEMVDSIMRDIAREADVGAKLQDIRRETGIEGLDRSYFESLYSHSSIEEFVSYAAQTRAKRIPGLTRIELVDIIRRAMDVTSWDAQYYMDLFDANVPMPSASSLIFHPPDSYEGKISDYEITAEEIVDLATSRSSVIYL